MDHYSKTTNANWLTCDFTQVTINGVAGTIQTNGPFSVLPPGSYQDTFDGYRNPYWKSTIRAGGNATTPAVGVKRALDLGEWYFRSVVTNIINPSLVTTEESWGTLRPPQIFGLDAAASASIVTQVTNRAISKFLERADSVRSAFEAGQDLGELKETIHSIISPMKSLRELTVGYFERLKKNAKKAKSKHSLKKVIADSYLEYSFGWKPLAADIADGYAALTNNQGHQPQVVVSASAGMDFQGSTFEGTAHGPSINIVHINGKVTNHYNVHIKGAIRSDAVNGRIGLAQNLQLDLPHFVPTLWDLLPYSWIADYFTNIGDCIRAVSFRSANLVWGFETIRTEAYYEYSIGRIVPNFNASTSRCYTVVGDYNPRATSTTFRRSSISSAALLPDFRFEIPLSAKPWENMGALLTSRAKDCSGFLSKLFK